LEPHELEIVEEVEKLEEHALISPNRQIINRFKKNKPAVFGLIVVLILVLVAVFAPWIAPYSYDEVNYKESLKPPSAKHWLGTDILGRDIFSRIVYGSRVSLEVGIIAVAISVSIGVVLGLISGYFGGWVDALIMRLVDITYSFPFLLFAIAIMTILGPGFINVFIAIGIINWAWFARVTRGSVLAAKEQEYILAAVAMGASSARIMFKHIMPNVIAPVIVGTALNSGYAILAEAALSFLGIGVQPPYPSWGLMLSDARNYITTAPWMTIYPGLAIALTVLGFILLGNGLRDAIDPRMKV
jgi:peptide/nickel transport system permease protein